MKHRNIFSVLLLGFITFGIYTLYWLVDTKRVLNQKTSKHVPSIWLFLGPWVAMAICFVGLALANPPAYGDDARNIAAGSSTSWSTLAVLSVVGIVVSIIAGFITNILWTYRYSQAVDEYTKGTMSTTVGFLVLLFLQWLGIILIQDAYNSIPPEEQPVAGMPPPTPQPPVNPMPPSA